MGHRKNITSTSYESAVPVAGEDMFLGPAEIKCSKVEAQIVEAGVWTTLLNISDGPALVTRLWIATMTGGRLCPIRISFDGSPTPQIIGFTGEIFATGFDNDTIFRNLFIGVSRCTSTAFSGFLNILMPYYSSIKLEVYGGGAWWAQIQRRPITQSEITAIGLTWGMTLHTYGYGQAGSKLRYTEITLLETTSKTILAGLFHFLQNNNPTYVYLEGNYKIYYGGSITASFETSGTEDFYDSSWYFAENKFSVEDECLAFINAAAYNISASRFFPLEKAPCHANGLKLTWNVGQNGQGDPGETVYSRYIVWYWQ